MIEAEFLSGDSESRSLIGVVFVFAVVDAILVSGASDLIEAESVSVDSFVDLGASDLIGGDCVSGESESGSLCVVFTVVESLADFGVTELGKDGSGVPGLVSGASDLMGGEFVSDDSFVVLGASGLMGGDCVSDESESGSLSVVVFAVVESLAGLEVTESGENGSGVSVLVSSAFDLMGGDSVSDDSESGSNIVAVFVIGDVDALSTIYEFLTSFFCADGDTVTFISSSSPPFILVDHSNRNTNI